MFICMQLHYLCTYIHIQDHYVYRNLQNSNHQNGPKSKEINAINIELCFAWLKVCISQLGCQEKPDTGLS